MPDFVDVQTSRIQYLAIGASIALIVGVIELIRRRRLREEYALLWLASALVFLFFSVWRGAFDALAHFLGIAYGPALLILVILFAGFVILISFSMSISRLTHENKRLAQELAILSKNVEERSRTHDDVDPGA